MFRAAEKGKVWDNKLKHVLSSPANKLIVLFKVILTLAVSYFPEQSKLAPTSWSQINTDSNGTQELIRETGGFAPCRAMES